MYDVEGYEDIMGAEGDLLGAVQKAIARRGPGGRRVFSKPPLAARPGQPDAKLRSYMGLGIVTWAPAQGQDQTMTVEPQESFRGERLVLTPVISGGADTEIILLRRIDVGTQPQSPSVEQAAPISMFSADATYAGLDLQVAHRGMKFSVTLGRTGVTPAGVTAKVSAGLYGEWIR